MGRVHPVSTRPTAPLPRVSAADAVWTLARWGVRLLVVAGVVYLLARAAEALSVVTVPLVVAVLLTALVVPVRSALERVGLPRVAATTATVVAVLVGLGLVGWVVAMRAATEGPRLLADLQSTLGDIRVTLAEGPFAVGSHPVAELQDRLTSWAQQNRGLLVSDAFAGADLTLRTVFGIFLTLLLTVLFLWDGDRLWGLVVTAAGPRWSGRVGDAGRTAWHSVAGYVHGSLAVALFHGVVIGTTLALLRVPLALVLALLVFLGGFVPVVGAVATGGVAVLVALATRGPVDALVVLGVLVVASQVDAHVLQPVVMRRFLRLHPVVTVLAVTGMGVLWGVPGALVAVPLSAVVARVVPVLLGWSVVDDHGEVRPLRPTTPAPAPDPRPAPDPAAEDPA